jgi:hypothetical protein
MSAKKRMLLALTLLLAVSALWIGASNAQAQDSTADRNGCEAAFEDVQNFTAQVFANSTSEIKDGVVAWDSTDWENIVRRVVGSSEFYLNNCLDGDLSMAQQDAEIAHFAELSLLKSPVDMLDVGGDFGDVQLTSDFAAQTELIDLNGDGTDELVLHTQVPYFSQETVYQIRGGLSIAFFHGEDGWQGQVIAPVTSFVTDESGDHVSFAMIEDGTLTADTASEALHYFPAPTVDVFPVAGAESPLTAITLYSTTGAGEAKELNILSWEGRIPSVKLRIAFDDWCYPGRTLDWEIREDGSVFVPSNGGKEDSPLHCGRTPEVLFQWQDGQYVAVED